MPDYLFVYESEEREVVARHATAVGRAVLRARRWGPGAERTVVRSPEPADRVSGFVYRLEEGLREVLLAELDALERNLRRERVAVHLESGESVTAWVYLWARTPPPGGRLR